MKNNKLIIASAGSGKTTMLIDEASKRFPDPVLILTYTEENEQEIVGKIRRRQKLNPQNITVQTWFSFLIQHGVKPYQGLMHGDLYVRNISGLLLTNQQSGIKTHGKKFNVYYSEGNEFMLHYFSPTMKIYSDKLSKFVVRCNKKSDNEVVNRISRLYNHIFIDEVQDLAGYDLVIIDLLAKSEAELLLVGDPRQVTYLTHHESKYAKYQNGGIKNFILDNCKKTFQIDEDLLKVSHRNNKLICEFSSKLYPDLLCSMPCNCTDCRCNVPEHLGIYLVRPNDVDEYMKIFNPIQLRLSIKTEVRQNYDCYNFGASKGKTFGRVIIYPSKNMVAWIYDNNSKLESGTRAKFYVALTRARHSVAIIVDYKDKECFSGAIKWK